MNTRILSLLYLILNICKFICIAFSLSQRKRWPSAMEDHLFPVLKNFALSVPFSLLVSSFWTMYVCLCAVAYKYCVYIHVQCRCMWRPEGWHLPQSLFPKDPSTPSSPALKLQNCAAKSRFLNTCWKSKLGSSCLYSKHYQNKSHLQPLPSESKLRKEELHFLPYIKGPKNLFQI